MNSKKARLKKILSPELKKLNSALKFLPDEQKYQKIKKQADELMLEGNINEAQKLYSQYKKAKTELVYNNERYEKSAKKLQYLETIVFGIENSQNFQELAEIEAELGIKNKKKEDIPKITKIEFRGWDIYIGKNNKQNDYLISKIAKGDDIWFHGLNYPSCHIILKASNNKKEPPKEVLEYCAKLTKDNSKARNATKASVIMTKRKNLKKPPDTYPGYVTYKNEVEIVI